MVTEINEGRGCGPNKDHVLLDITHLDPEVIMSKLPGIREISIKFAGVDPIKAPIPVVPTCHYQMGGIPTNYKGEVLMGDATVPGFYAAGECACASVHGANRLGTNSLLDLLVFGKSSGNSMIEFIKNSHESFPEVAMQDVERSVARVARLDNQTSGTNVNEARLAMQRTMQAHAGVFRFKDMLAEGVAKILEVERMIKTTFITDKSKTFNTARLEALELENLIEVAKATMISANARTESRGAHVRDDAIDSPEQPNGRDDKNWLKHSLWFSSDNRLEYKPVNLTPLTVESVALKTRSY